MRGRCDVTVRSYFLELYNDALVDLYERIDNPKGRGTPPRLEVKVDPRKMVFVKGAVVDGAGRDRVRRHFNVSRTTVRRGLGNLSRRLPACRTRV